MSEEEVVPPGYVNNLFNIQGRIAAITGGGSGLGSAIAIGYAQAGVKIALVDVNVEGMERTKTIIEKQGGVAEIYSCDVTSSASVKDCAEKISTKFGGVDILSLIHI